jgi:putative DNA primase/helicase
MVPFNATAADLTRSSWPEPRPLPVGLPAVAEFDFELLPATLQPWARDICDRVQCPPDFVGVTVMASLGSVLGRKVGVCPQEHTDWIEVPNQWALVIGRPGVLKSPAMEAALSPVKRRAAHANESHEAERSDYEHKVKVAKLRAEAGEKQARKVLEKNANADVADFISGDAPEAPTLRRYIANDTTAASLGELLRQNPNGTLVFRDEIVSLLRTLDREDNADARGFYLTGWNGNSSYTFDRIGRGMNLCIPAVCISMLGSTQPGRIADYVRVAVKGGHGDDGLIQRFGLTVWPDIGPDWRNVDRWPDSKARQEANRVYEMLDELDATAVGAQSDDDENPPFLRFDNAGRELFLEWRTKLEARLRANEMHQAIEAHLAKYRKLVPTLALILHLADNGTGPVTERATLKALAWAEYLETHAGRLYASATNPDAAAAKAILAKIRQGELPHRFAARDVYRAGWANLSDRGQVGDGLQLLLDLDWLVTHTRDTPGRTATEYEVNPRGLRT